MRFTPNDIIAWTKGRLVNESELGANLAQISIERPGSLGSSRSGEVAFFFSPAFKKDLGSALPGILVTGEAFVSALAEARLPLWKKTAVIACEDPYLALAQVSAKIAESLSSVAHIKPPKKKSIHPSAIVHETAEIGEAVEIGPYCVIEAGVKIGSRTVLYPSCVIGPWSTIGNDSVLFPGVTLYEWTQVGHRVRIHAGVVLGADGFGYAPKREDGKVVSHKKIYHLGKVVIDDDVEIGANSCIDRSTFGDTRVGRMAKIDNHVQIGHNCQIEEGAIICGSAGLAGSVEIGKFATIGGLAGISNQVRVGEGASVAACSLISKDVPPGAVAIGNPQREYREHFRAHAVLNRLASAKRKPARE